MNDVEQYTALVEEISTYQSKLKAACRKIFTQESIEDYQFFYRNISSASEVASKGGYCMCDIGNLTGSIYLLHKYMIIEDKKFKSLSRLAEQVDAEFC